MKNKQLPKGWREESLSNVADILDSKRVPINASERKKRKGKIPYYGATGQVGWIDDFIFDEELILLGEDGAPFLNPYKNKAYLINGKSWVNNHAHVLRAKSNLLNKFLLYFLNILNYQDYVSGTTRLKLNQSRMKQIKLPLPPIPLQTIIVQAIETQFSRLDKSINSLKAVKKKLEVYRKAVLKKAFEDCTKWIRVGDVVDMQSGHAFKKSEYSENGVKLFQIANVTFGKTTWEKIAYLPESYLRSYSELKLNNKDVIMALNRPLLNHELKITVLSESDIPAILYQRVGRFIFLKDENKKFFFYYFRSLYFIQQLEKSLKGINIPFINKSNLMNFKYPEFDLKNQKQIVSQIESKFSIIDKVEQTVNQSLIKAEQLRKSILKKAFEGRLVKPMEIKNG